MPEGFDHIKKWGNHVYPEEGETVVIHSNDDHHHLCTYKGGRIYECQKTGKKFNAQNIYCWWRQV